MTYVAEIKTLKTLSIKGTAVSDRGVEAVSGLGLSSLFLSGTKSLTESLKALSSFNQIAAFEYWSLSRSQRRRHRC